MFSIVFFFRISWSQDLFGWHMIKNQRKRALKLQQTMRLGFAEEVRELCEGREWRWCEWPQGKVCQSWRQDEYYKLSQVEEIQKPSTRIWIRFQECYKGRVNIGVANGTLIRNILLYFGSGILPNPFACSQFMSRSESEVTSKASKSCLTMFLHVFTTFIHFLFFLSFLKHAFIALTWHHPTPGLSQSGWRFGVEVSERAVVFWRNEYPIPYQCFYHVFFF